MSRKFLAQCLISGILSVAAVSCRKCEPPRAQLEVSQSAKYADAVTVRAIIPAGLSASELVSYNTLAANAVLIQTSRQEQAFALKQAQLQAKQEAGRRRDWFIFALMMQTIFVGAFVFCFLFLMPKGGRR